MEMKKLNGKVALVTGASRGIGRAIALRLAQDGALVAVHYGRNREMAEEAAAEIVRSGGSAFALGMEFGASRGIRATAEALYQALDEALIARTTDHRFDILVNNAGLGMVKSLEETTEDAMDELLSVNVKMPFFMIQQALPRLREEGRILNLSSAVTRISLPAIPAYSMTKGALNTLTLSLSNQLGPRGITINAIQPGFVATDMNAGMLQDEAGRKFGADFSIFGRWGEPADVADIAAFLASSDSRWITGQCIDASGGSHL